MAGAIKVSDIKWAYSIKIDSNPLKGFIHHLSLFIGEILRSDEIGLIVWQGQPILMFRIYKVDFNTNKTYVEVIGFEDSKFEEMLIELNLHNRSSAVICSGFEVFCYRPKPDKPYHPKIHPTYIRARERASRILNGVWAMAINPDEGVHVSFAQVDAKISTNFFKRMSKQKEIQNDEILNLVVTVNNWVAEFYTDQIGSKHYKTKNRYPLAPKPLNGSVLLVLTSDDDGNLISYQSEV
ncbi:hypothetical protein [Coleofasciculus sp. FACHB-SPT9]|uniref:hypothetical protein n=1 Tax=Cyanophyceae TaxID=3028117 RepID=UPI0016876FC3|nr:hypothetical protein [Coleofasciculus sp. FACHB-SPT9]MBD1890639.1 hypothetical protein [Coleofasciculus sp. FACHB-SPT9]